MYPGASVMETNKVDAGLRTTSCTALRRQGHLFVDVDFFSFIGHDGPQ
jgi:hypothetical protein